VTFLVTFDGRQADWHVDRDVLISSVRRDWPDAVMTEARDDLHDVSWTEPGAAEPFEAYVNVAGTCLYIDGSLDKAAELALWFRRLVPETIEAVFCDDEYSFAIPVTTRASLEDLTFAGN
jgi:hypothetical protein